MKSTLLLFFLFFTFSLSAKNEVIFIAIAGHKLKVEVADTEAKRQTGLMFRKSLAESEGMLFVFKEPIYLSFWMKNTMIPLSIAYFNRDRRLIDIFTMKPNQTHEVYNSTEKAMYAVEVNQGWFDRKGIGKYAPLVLEREIKGR